MTDIVLSDTQAAAVREIVAWYQGGRDTPQEFYLAGYAGTGKSTLAKYALAELRAHGGLGKTATATFTGKAASVLRKKGVYDARTVHSLIYVPTEDPETGETTFTVAPEAPAADADLIMLDEVSMISQDMADDVRSFGKKMLVMGDPGQLPPINGQGAFTNREPDVFLHEVHRQAAESPILRLATAARQGQQLPLGEWTDAVGNVSRVVAHNRDNQHWIYREDTMPLCGIHRVRHGYTQRIRRMRGFEGPRPMPGETIICCRNDKKTGLFNGAFGIAGAWAPYPMVGPDLKPMDAPDQIRLDLEMEDFPGRMIKQQHVNTYLFDQHFDDKIVRPRKVYGLEFDWANLLTVHKAQGSEFPDVTVIDDSGSFRDDRAKHLYTALTRASERVTIMQRQ